MNYTTVYVGMDVHKETFSLCCYTNEKEQAEYCQKVSGHYSKVLNYLEAMRLHYGNDAVFVCGYEAGCRNNFLLMISCGNAPAFWYLTPPGSEILRSPDPPPGRCRGWPFR